MGILSQNLGQYQDMTVVPQIAVIPPGPGSAVEQHVYRCHLGHCRGSPTCFGCLICVPWASKPHTTGRTQKPHGSMGRVLQLLHAPHPCRHLCAFICMQSRGVPDRLHMQDVGMKSWKEKLSPKGSDFKKKLGTRQ